MAYFHRDLEWNRRQGGNMAIRLTPSIRDGGYCLQLAPPQLQIRPPHPMGTNLVIYNIYDGLGFELVQEILAVEKDNYDLILPNKTKVMDEVYCYNRLRYDSVCSKATVTTTEEAQGGLE